jgi:hypothetical protein
MSLLRGCETGTTAGANISVKAGSCLTDKRIASFDDRDNDDPSDDVTLKQCISGFVANKDKAFINGLPVPFDQCCKCKPGELCELCEIPSNCTDEEKERFVAQEACFGTEAGETTKPAKDGCPACPEQKECWGFTKLWYGLVVLLLAVILGFILGKML